MTINFTLYALRATLLMSAKSCVLLFCLGFMGNTAFAQIQDNVINDPGDIAIVAYNGTNQSISFVLLDNCPAGTVIKFTDEEWTGSAFASATNEGDVTWTNTSAIARGTVIHMQSGSAATPFDAITCNFGTATETDAGFNCATADGVTAFIGSRSSVTAFLTFYGDATTLATSFTGTGLTVGVNAITTAANAAGGRYTGGTICNSTVIACATMINTISNWTAGDSYTYPTQVVQSFNGTVLPIELTAFDVQNTEGSKNRLTWTTASEKNNSHFDIERSTDGNTFHNIGQVRGNNKPSTYQFVDNQPFATSYYRLKQVDFDGTETYSKVVSVEQKGRGKGLKIYPTLVSNVLTVEYTEGASFQVINLLGQQVLTGRTSFGGRGLDVSALPQGTYLLKVGTEVAKFVKQ